MVCSHQLNSKNNGPVLLFNGLYWGIWNCPLSSVATNGKDGHGLKLEKSWAQNWAISAVSSWQSPFNPFTAKCGQRQISTKFPNFIFWNFDKKIALCESTGRELSFEWSHHRISSIHSKVRVTLQNTLAVKGLIAHDRAQKATRPFSCWAAGAWCSKAYWLGNHVLQ